uniref:Potassium channel domain-containing protein n=1 Tax=Meloidogyne incognita TaxID=6306 RepID=A0A914NVB2_MELIC
MGKINQNLLRFVENQIFSESEFLYFQIKNIKSKFCIFLEIFKKFLGIFFTSTLLTTIGYGNLVPVTSLGRMFCIFYALFGVPLILITVTDIGKVFPLTLFFQKI